VAAAVVTLCWSEFRPDDLSSSGDKASWSPLPMLKPSRPENPASPGGSSSTRSLSTRRRRVAVLSRVLTTVLRCRPWGWPQLPYVLAARRTAYGWRRGGSALPLLRLGSVGCSQLALPQGSGPRRSRRARRARSCWSAARRPRRRA
jgi:hypothetical protein